MVEVQKDKQTIQSKQRFPSYLGDGLGLIFGVLFILISYPDPVIRQLKDRFGQRSTAKEVLQIQVNPLAAPSVIYALPADRQLVISAGDLHYTVYGIKELDPATQPTTPAKDPKWRYFSLDLGIGYHPANPRTAAFVMDLFRTFPVQMSNSYYFFTGPDGFNNQEYRRAWAGDNLHRNAFFSNDQRRQLIFSVYDDELLYLRFDYNHQLFDPALKLNAFSDSLYLFIDTQAIPAPWRAS